MSEYNAKRIDLKVFNKQIISSEQSEEFVQEVKALLYENENTYSITYDYLDDDDNLVKANIKYKKGDAKISFRRFGSNAYQMNLIEGKETSTFVNSVYGKLKMNYFTHKIKSEFLIPSNKFVIEIEYDLMFPAQQVIKNNLRLECQEK